MSLKTVGEINIADPLVDKVETKIAKVILQLYDLVVLFEGPINSITIPLSFYPAELTRDIVISYIFCRNDNNIKMKREFILTTLGCELKISIPIQDEPQSSFFLFALLLGIDR